MADRVVAGRHIVLVLATSTGGVGRHVHALAAELCASGADVVVAGPATTEQHFTFSATGARFAAVEIASGLRPVADFAALRQLRRVVRGADLVHAHGLRAGFVSAWSVPRDTPLVVTWHNAVLAGAAAGRVYARLERVVARRAAITLCVSADLAARVRELGGRDVRLSPVGATRPPPPRRSPDDVRAELGAGGRPLVVAVGRLHPQKGLDTLVEAAALMRDDPVSPVVVVAGDGPARAELERRIVTSAADVRLLGWRDDVADLHRAADVVVLPSRWEGSPLAAHEALFAGRPFVATAVGGMPDLVTDDSGLLVPAGDAPALAAALRQVLTDRPLAQRLAAGAARRADEWPDAARTVVDVLRVYESLVTR